MGDHDSLFKRAFSVPAHAAGELRSVLPPAITDRLDLDALALVPATFIDAEMGHRHADLLFTAPFEGRRCYVYLLFEHQSAPDPLMPWRVLTYQQRIWASVLRAEPERTTLPPIITVVVHHGPDGWQAPRTFHAMIEGLDGLPELERHVPDFELIVDDLCAVEDEDLQRRPLAPFPKLTLWLLRDGRDVERLLDHLAAWAATLERLARDDPQREDTLVVLRYILRVAGPTPYEHLRQRVTDVAPTFEEVMASAEQYFIEQGIEKGIEKGTRRTILRLLRTRFGPLEPAIEARVEAASSDDLDRWTERIIVAKTLDDVFAPA
ncbi:MAG: Rpn family recombination-promoting nuclease/putative transposase [Labilithrix sp.]|nr:Rpn family recombination-promoting nuclease/putative transposase [Labilithrix sp.]MCW5817049.1 Rpn family recombination-promoting nuclease/putative transposase [Labilithrix sp.]